MTVDHHRRAEELMDRGDRARASGDMAVASRAYAEAAQEEALAFEAVAPDRPKTRGVLGTSTVALYRLAGLGAQAKRQAYAVLADGRIPPESASEVEMILDELRTEEMAGLYRQQRGLQWALRGGRVGFGIARSETVTQKIDQVQRLAWRVFEMLTGRNVRTNQPVPDDVRRAVDLLVTQPVAGSFSFGITLADRQLAIDDEDLEAADAVTSQILEVLHASQLDEDHPLDDLVPDPSYREIFLRMVRNLAPDGREVGEIEVREFGSVGPATILSPATRTRIRHRLPTATADVGQGAVELRDVLRVIDLNRRRIAIGAVGREQRCSVPEDLALVDLIEGLEDRPVIVRGHWQGKTFVVHDVEPDYPYES